MSVSFFRLDVRTAAAEDADGFSYVFLFRFKVEKKKNPCVLLINVFYVLFFKAKCTLLTTWLFFLLMQCMIIVIFVQFQKESVAVFFSFFGKPEIAVLYDSVFVDGFQERENFYKITITIFSFFLLMVQQ